MHTRLSPDARLVELAAAQCGLVSAEQALLLGLSRESVRRLVRQCHWTRLSKGVYDTRPGAEEAGKRIWAAALRAGDPCAVGGEAALFLYGLDCQVDRWNLHDHPWWASWALTPHHYYHPRVAGILILE